MNEQLIKQAAIEYALRVWDGTSDASIVIEEARLFEAYINEQV